MYEKIAWNNFLKTGNVESFLEYRRLLETNNNIASNINNMQHLDERIRQNVGELLNEIDKSKGNRY